MKKFQILKTKQYFLVFWLIEQFLTSLFLRFIFLLIFCVKYVHSTLIKLLKFINWKIVHIVQKWFSHSIINRICIRRINWFKINLCAELLSNFDRRLILYHKISYVCSFFEFSFEFISLFSIDIEFTFNEFWIKEKRVDVNFFAVDFDLKIDFQKTWILSFILSSLFDWNLMRFVFFYVSKGLIFFIFNERKIIEFRIIFWMKFHLFHENRLSFFYRQQQSILIFWFRVFEHVFFNSFFRLIVDTRRRFFEETTFWFFFDENSNVFVLSFNIIVFAKLKSSITN